MNFAARFKNTFFDYSELFSALKKEKGIGKSLGFYGFFVIILLVINWILLSIGEIPANISILKGVILTDTLIFYIPLYFFILNILILFIFSGFMVTFSRLMKNKSTLSNNIKVFAHTFVPFVLTSWITALNMIFGLWSVYLSSRGLSEMNNIGFKKSFSIVILSGLFTGIIVFFVVYAIMFNFGITMDLERIFLTRS